jgi:hypothetical protein
MHSLIKLGTTRSTVAGKNPPVSQLSIVFERTCSCIEGLFSYEDMHVVINEVLRDENTLIGQSDH